VSSHHIARVGGADLDELVPLMRAYCDFYEVAPGDDALRALATTLLEDPEHAGIQLIARDDGGRAVGFATIFWSFSTLSAAPIGVMNDLYVEAGARGRGTGVALISACAAECAARGVPLLEWETAPDNLRAQSVYARTGASRTTWVSYSLPVTTR
jgi:GNAT superfamily N-acetyltransferase